MSEHHASLHWKRTSSNFTYESYNRAHALTFKSGNVTLMGSSAAEFRGDADLVNPEELLVSALSSCHMLSFLAICARRRLSVETYDDDAVGYLAKGDNGKLWVTRTILRPRVCFTPGTALDEAELARIHHQSHAECFIANSVKTDVSVEPQF